VILALAASLAIVQQDHTALRAAPRAAASELTTLWQGDVVEVRGERGGYLRVYNYRRERGGYVKGEQLRPVSAAEADAPELLAVTRFLRDSPGFEALGISYGAAYLKAAPPRALSAEAFDAIAVMAERLADQASGNPAQRTAIAAHLDVVGQFGVRMVSFERNGRMQVCYDGELFARVLAQPGASNEQRAHAVLALTRPECIDPSLGPTLRAALDDERRGLLARLDERNLRPLTRSRLHARRAAVWSSLVFEAARHGEPSAPAAQEALVELLAVHTEDLGADRRGEYLDAVVRVGAIRWAAAPAAPQATALTVTTEPGAPGQTCVTLKDSRRQPAALLVRRCTYGIVWTASAQTIAQGQALVLAVQPLESWRELWVFHATADGWVVDVIPPGANDPESGYVDFAGFVPGTRRVLVVREVQDRGRFSRRFEELRLDDLALVKQATSAELLPDFGRWQDVAWRRDTLALR
jgi:hypothetical protein